MGSRRQERDQRRLSSASRPRAPRGSPLGSERAARVEMGLLSKKAPKPEDVYNAVKSGNVAEVTKLLEAGGSPEKHEDGFVRGSPRGAA